MQYKMSWSVPGAWYLNTEKREVISHGRFQLAIKIGRAEELLNGQQSLLSSAVCQVASTSSLHSIKAVLAQIEEKDCGRCECEWQSKRLSVIFGAKSTCAQKGVTHTLSQSATGVSIFRQERCCHGPSLHATLQLFSTANFADDLFIMPGPLRTKTENEWC